VSTNSSRWIQWSIVRRIWWSGIVRKYLRKNSRWSSWWLQCSKSMITSWNKEKLVENRKAILTRKMFQIVAVRRLKMRMIRWLYYILLKHWSLMRSCHLEMLLRVSEWTIISISSNNSHFNRQAKYHHISKTTSRNNNGQTKM